MHMRALVPLFGVLLACGVATAQLFPPVPPPVAGGKQPAQVVKMIAVNYFEPLLELKHEVNPLLSHGLLPAGITAVVPLKYQHALLVGASGETIEAAEEAINQLEQLVRLLDMPRRQIGVQFTCVAMKEAVALPFIKEWGVERLLNKPASTTTILWAATEKVKTGNARIVEETLCLLPTGGEGTVGFPAEIVSLRGIAITAIKLCPDDSIDMRLAPISDAKVLPGSLATAVRVADGASVLVGTVIDPDTRDYVLIIMQPQVLRWYGMNLTKPAPRPGELVNPDAMQWRIPLPKP